jgi:hypothetical protein
VILTDNTSDFVQSDLPVYRPVDFIALFKWSRCRRQFCCIFTRVILWILHFFEGNLQQYLHFYQDKLVENFVNIPLYGVYVLMNIARN